MEKAAKTIYPIQDLIQRRWSPRSFAEKSIDAETLTKLFDAARWAASWRNEQPWRFIVATRDDNEEFQKLFECLKPGNQTWAGKAGALVVAVVNLNYSHIPEPNPTTYYDLGQAVANLTIEAMNHDLYVHQMGGVFKDKIREVYNIPEGFAPVTVMAIGYIGAVDDLPEDLQLKEQGERVRKPLNETVFSGTWEQAADLG